MNSYLWLVWCDAGDHHGPDFRPKHLFESFEDAATWIMLQGEGRTASEQYRHANYWNITEVRMAEKFDLLTKAQKAEVFAANFAEHEEQ